MPRWYRIGEVALLSGVSIRTLDHFDQIGVLCPSGQTDGGHRLYRTAELLRLQRVLSLRRFGFPLKRIAEVLDQPDEELVLALLGRHGELADQIADLERRAGELRRLIGDYRQTGRGGWETVRAAASEDDGRDREEDAMDAPFAADHLAAMQDRFERLSPAERAAFDQEWDALVGEASAKRDLDPGGALAQELAARWDTLLRRTYQDDDVIADVRAVFAKAAATSIGDDEPLEADAESAARLIGGWRLLVAADEERRRVVEGDATERHSG